MVMSGIETQTTPIDTFAAVVFNVPEAHIPLQAYYRGDDAKLKGETPNDFLFRVGVNDLVHFSATPFDMVEGTVRYGSQADFFRQQSKQLYAAYERFKVWYKNNYPDDQDADLRKINTPDMRIKIRQEQLENLRRFRENVQTLAG